MSKELDIIEDEKTKRKKMIDSTCLRLNLEAKEQRKKWSKYLVYTVASMIIVTIGTYLSFSVPNNQLQTFLVLTDFLVLAIGGGFLILAVRRLFRPLTSTYTAVKQIFEAIQTIDTLHEQIAYENAYESLKKALKNLNRVRNSFLIELDWYNKLNTCISEFVDDLELVLIPATYDRTVKKEDLEDYALALYSLDKEELIKVKQTINERVSKEIYKKTDIPSTAQQWITWKRFSENKIGKLTISVFLGYGLVLLICGVYVLATQQDFIVFARDRPDVIVIGGLVASGITFWRESKNTITAS